MELAHCNETALQRLIHFACAHFFQIPFWYAWVPFLMLQYGKGICFAVHIINAVIVFQTIALFINLVVIIYLVVLHLMIQAMQ